MARQFYFAERVQAEAEHSLCLYSNRGSDRDFSTLAEGRPQSFQIGYFKGIRVKDVKERGLRSGKGSSRWNIGPWKTFDRKQNISLRILF